MTNREAIEMINKIKLAEEHNCEVYEIKPNYELREALNLSIQALEKQEPKKPKKYIGEYLHESYPICSKCKDELMPNGETYCSNCGQAIDWSE